MSKAEKSQDNYIYAYYQRIKDGSICVNKWIRIIYEKIIEGCNKKEFVFDQKKASSAIDWIEAHCFHTEGPLAPGPFKLELWQKALISVMFGICDAKTGLRQFREVLLVVARKNGKSLLASAIAKYTFQIDGGYGAKVYCLAPKLEQANIIYDNVGQMIQLDPEQKALRLAVEQSKDEHNKKQMDDSELIKVRHTDIYLASSNSTFKKIAFNAKKSDGFNPSLAICDEVASWEGDAGLKQYEVMKSGMGARPEGLILSCTTSGYVNDSIYDELIARATRFLLGDSKERKLLPFIYMIEDLDKWNDLNELRKSNPNLGVSVSEDYLLEEIAIAEGSLSKKAEFFTKYCNIKQNSSLAWFDFKSVDQCCGDDFSLEDFRGCYCTVGIDLSQTTDLTAIVVSIEKKGRIYNFAKFYMPENQVANHLDTDRVPYDIYHKRGFLEYSGENYIDYNDCFKFLMELVSKYEIYPLKVGYDRYTAQYLIKDLTAQGFQCDDVFQGENLTPVINEVEGLVKDGTLRFGTNDLMKVHMLNAAIKVNNETNRKRLVKIGQYNRIDGVAALLDSMCVRQKWYEEIGQLLKNEGK